MLIVVLPTTLIVVDSTPLIDLYDVDTSWGKSSHEWFKSFKIHTSVNQQGLPLRAKVTPANCYDSPILPDIAWDLKANYLLTDAGYDSKLNRQVAKSIGATLQLLLKTVEKEANKTQKPKLDPNIVVCLGLNATLLNSLTAILRLIY